MILEDTNNETDYIPKIGLDTRIYWNASRYHIFSPKISIKINSGVGYI